MIDSYDVELIIWGLGVCIIAFLHTLKAGLYYAWWMYLPAITLWGIRLYRFWRSRQLARAKKAGQEFGEEVEEEFYEEDIEGMENLDEP